RQASTSSSHSGTRASDESRTSAFTADAPIEARPEHRSSRPTNEQKSSDRPLPPKSCGWSDRRGFLLMHRGEGDSRGARRRDRRRRARDKGTPGLTTSNQDEARALSV